MHNLNILTKHCPLPWLSPHTLEREVEVTTNNSNSELTKTRLMTGPWRLGLDNTLHISIFALGSAQSSFSPSPLARPGLPRRGQTVVTKSWWGADLITHRTTHWTPDTRDKTRTHTHGHRPRCAQHPLAGTSWGLVEKLSEYQTPPSFSCVS